MDLKTKIRSNKLTIGSWITIGHHSIVEILSTAGFEWLAIDLEHSSIDLETAQNLIAHIKSNNMAALVRVGKNEEVIIKRVMDAGADGVIVPMINSKSDALLAVNYTKYPPEGKRGVGLSRAQKYGIGFNEYKKWQKDNSVVIAQIENIEAVKNIREILSVKEIDGIIIGPYDLSASMGFAGNFERKEFLAAVKSVEAECKKRKKALGFHVILPYFNHLDKKIKSGYSLLAFSIDFYFLGEMARNEMNKFKKKYENKK
ncbi:MAG: 2,4-dihydroxyhept-2-ene-1,7-dioic acid aldolase [Ignavibacteriaceae bacterium]|jgi:2-dehydro-3-deoxyglucarate aldolase|nr:2,4-dihydroxyhept-2-ene-1,7-dioic acid aldolase [Ignavibacteriaceae bacterium]